MKTADAPPQAPPSASPDVPGVSDGGVWGHARHYFIYGDPNGKMPSCSDVGLKFNLSLGAVKKRSQREKWMDQRAKAREEHEAIVHHSRREVAEEVAKTVAEAEGDLQIKLLEQELGLRVTAFNLLGKSMKGMENYLKAQESGGKLLLSPETAKDVANQVKVALQGASMAVFGMQPRDLSPKVHNYLLQMQGIVTPVTPGTGEAVPAPEPPAGRRLTLLEEIQQAQLRPSRFPVDPDNPMLDSRDKPSPLPAHLSMVPQNPKVQS
jgi:hypothetical protein